MIVRTFLSLILLVLPAIVFAHSGHTHGNWMSVITHSVLAGAIALCLFILVKVINKSKNKANNS